MVAINQMMSLVLSAEATNQMFTNENNALEHLNRELKKEELEDYKKIFFK